MTIRPDATKRISSMKMALAFGLMPVLLPALWGSESGLLVTPAQAADCAETRHVVLRAERPPLRILRRTSHAGDHADRS